MDSTQNRPQTDLPRPGHHESSNDKNPPSASSSPSHEFSFTISLDSSNPNITLPGSGVVLNRNAATKTLNNSSWIDPSPADEIFFHGHLLPLHLLPRVPPSATSPRSSTNSLDSFTLPIKDLIFDEQRKPTTHEEENRPRPRPTAPSKSDSKIARKSKSFSILGMPRWRKIVSEIRGRKDTSPNAEMSTNEGKTKRKQSKKNLVLDDVGQLLKRYIRMMRTLLFLKRSNRAVDGSRDEDINLELEISEQQCSSFSGNLNQWRTNKNEFDVMAGRRASEHFSSAPASMWTSPTNSGLLVPPPTGALRTSDSSTMEELQAAIQAAIAHCKNSIAAAEEGRAIKA